MSGKCRPSLRKKTLANVMRSPLSITDKECVKAVFEKFENMVEVRHGQWIEHYAYECWHYDCPFCDDGYATKERDITPPNYCPNCGARMDGGADSA